MKLFGKSQEPSKTIECIHEWYYESDIHRMCKKCGERQSFETFHDPLRGTGTSAWAKSYLGFSDWLRQAEKYRSSVERQKAEEEAEKKYFHSIEGK